MTAAASDFGSHFGINNIPFGIASSEKHESSQAVTRFENNVIFLADLVQLSPEFQQLPKDVFSKSTLNSFAELGRPAHRAVRQALQKLIKEDKLPSGSIEDVSQCQLHLPVAVADFTDFSCSEYHNLNAGHAAMGRRGLPPSWGFIPPGYAGRCSSIKISGTPVSRPRGQFWEDTFAAMRGENKKVLFRPCRKMDYELELAAVIGKPVPYGQSVGAKDAGENIFGFVMLNDWSARDIQQMEMIPLGPLNSKNSGTTMSPWIITYDALEPFRVAGPGWKHSLPPHLAAPNDRALSINLSVDVAASGKEAKTTCTANSNVLAWTFEQLLAHQASAGCGLQPGDLVACGTVSEDHEDKRGCMLEHNLPPPAPQRGYLADGDVVQFTGYCGEGVGFGESKAELLPALDNEVEVWSSE